MSEEKSYAKRRLLRDILEGNLDRDCLIADSVLEHLTDRDHVPPPDLRIPWMLSFFFLVLCNSILVLVIGNQMPRWFQVVSILLGLMVLIWAAYVQHQNTESLKIARRQLVEPLIELEGIRSSLTDYLSQLDRRMSKYFHCVTNTKVTTYFILRQIEEKLVERISMVEGLLSGKSYQMIREAYFSMVGSITFKDGFSGRDGNLYVVPIPSIRKIIVQLTEELEAGVEGIEKEISEAKFSEKEVMKLASHEFDPFEN
jgi:hypothetical protein